MYQKVSKEDKIVEIELNEGSIIGFITNANESTRLTNKLSNFYVNGFNLSMDLADNGERIAMIENLFVEDYYKMQGFGTKLLKMFIHKAAEKKVQQIILMADKTEDNLFDLQSWYARYGFRLMQDDDEFALIVKKGGEMHDKNIQ